ncbi:MULTISPECIES: SPOR domain-containing protein [unclassified Polynucleobacter]|uniref:SPOR domain-containing protein n=1 Tax=unclassified Polynucleobacter TaxID=2640945 RepID=UPI001BFE7E04|nr:MULTISPECIES: SPOR domain-containing protein [unclassified Polynucleobacter]MBU3605719.1 SPOR domain-containing protein [Polynucleobacter sp. MWH-Creno-3A4]QWD77875.1 SPOR domain-containing protein [Polynucleobacter sp. MWH-Svant-W18]
MKKPNQETGFIKSGNNAQYGGTILGFVLGLGAGLALAFGITFYLNKNTPQERPGVRAPNLPLTIKPSPSPAEGEVAAPAAPLDLNKPLQGKSPAAASSDPIGDLVNGKKPVDSPPTLAPAAAKSDAIYFLQAGAFVKRADADAQKANLAIQGIQAQLSEVTSDGNTLWRVRVGPFNSVEESNPVRDKLNGIGVKPTLIKSSKS